MSYKYMLYEVPEPGIALVTFNRPEALNSLCPELKDELGQILKAIALDDAINVVVLTGAGKAFVSGADIKSMSTMSPLEAKREAADGQQLLFLLERMPQPVIAAVNGFCLGGGNEIAMACDFVYASEKARFGQPEILLGIMPGFGGTQRLPRLVGKAMAKELCMTGEFVKGETALRLGLANKIFPPDELMEETMKTARTIASMGKLAIRSIKRAIDRGMEADLPTACALEAESFAMCFTSIDSKEGLTAFVEKRKPAFKGGYTK